MVRTFLFDNMVTILFIVLCYAAYRISGLSLSFVANDLVQRVVRNSFLVLALIIPVLAGMGLNFAIVLGAMAGQIGIIMVTHWGIGGLAGIMVAAALATPMAILFGYLTGNLLNRTKGQEMITSMITGFFANGLYELVFLVCVGTIIPMKNDKLLLSGGVGIRNTVDLSKVKYSIDGAKTGIFQIPLPNFAILVAAVFGAWALYRIVKHHGSTLTKRLSMAYLAVALGIAVVSLNTIRAGSLMNNVKVPIATVILIALLCLFIAFITKTKLGQDFRTVGQDMHVAQVSGIQVNRTRVIAITISTVLAAWGQLILMQNYGTLNTYGMHEQVGRFAIAALLIGGASVQRATIGQALLGTVLFHTLFIISPFAGRNLFGDPQIGEFFRACVAYGVIAISLGMYAWKKLMQDKRRLSS